MKLGHTTIYVHDVKATVDFYQEAFGLVLYYMHDDNQYAQMSAESGTIAFYGDNAVQELLGIKVKKNRCDENSAGFEISLATTDVAAAFEKAIKAGAKPVLHPIQRSWGQVVSYVTDINGVLVEICSVIELPSSCE